MEFQPMTYLMKIMVKMMNKLYEYKNPYYNQYVAPYMHHFEKDGKDLGRIIWVNNVDGITIEKDK